MTNRLSESSSPYLLQHARQPVHWQEWGDAPFDEAKRRDCPVLLSIGYSTCHWCHVMAHESFDDEQVARIMNRHFVSIKVDREEYPELDRAAMQVCQMIHGHGGWPLNLVLTPEKRPFFASTYLPKMGRLGQPGWIETLESLHRYWTKDRERIYRTATTIETGYQTLSNPKQTESITLEQLTRSVDRWVSTFDVTYGGFGQPPKFPMGHALLYLLDSSELEKQTREWMAHYTIRQISRGGITDALEGGIHRYSTDREWRVPHFEKMLYDQAIWLLVVSEANRQHPSPLYLQNLNRTVDYLCSRLRSAHNGFYCGEDADSEGEEGTFYLWRTEELNGPFTAEEEHSIRETFRLRDEGNVTLEGSEEPDGRNVLYRKPLPPYDGRPPEMDDAFPLFEWEPKLRMIRDQRPRPARDEKILTDWNGLLIAGLARAGSTTNRTTWVNQAKQTAQFLKETLLSDREGWFHRYCNGDFGIPATSNDYAALLWGWLELYRATFDPHWLREGIQWATEWVEQFMEPESGALYLCRDGMDPLFAKQKPTEDGALPSCNSIAAHQFLRLGMITGDPMWLERADRILDWLSGSMQKWPGGHLHAIHAYEWSRNRHPIVVLTGTEGTEVLEKMRKVLYQTPGPGRWIAGCTSNHRESMLRLAPWMESLPDTEEATAWICYQTHCETKITDPTRLEQVLKLP